MLEPQTIPGTEPFFFEGNHVGVLLIHGFMDSPQSVRFLGETLAKDGGFTILGPRLTGHGTTPQDLANATAENWIRDLERALPTLRQKCSKTFVVGYSMGGTLALYMAAYYPDVFSGAATINGAIWARSTAFAALAFKPDTPFSFSIGEEGDIKNPELKELDYSELPYVCIRQLYALWGVTRGLLPNLTCPLMVFQSRQDHVVNPGNAPDIIAEVNSKEKRLIYLENSYHQAPLDNDKEFIARKLISFIRNHS